MTKTVVVLLLILTLVSSCLVANDKYYFSDLNVCIISQNCCGSLGGFLSVDGTDGYCIKSCPSTQYYTTELISYTNIKTCKTCPVTTPIPISNQTDCGLCTGDQIADITTHTCLDNSTKCTGFIQVDKKRCGPDCGSDYRPLDGKTCLNYCPLQDVRASTNGECLTAYSNCTNGVINEAGTQCIDKCPDGSAPEQKNNFSQCRSCILDNASYQIIDGVQKCVCEGGLIKNTNNNTCIQKESCQTFLSSDLTQCNPSCGNDYVNEKTDKSYIACTTNCNQLIYTIDTVNYCVSSCLGSQITDSKSKKCVSSKNDCQYALSYDGKNCVETCNLLKKEVIIDQQCQPCTNYLNISDNTCQTQCPPNTIEDQAKMVCYATESGCLTNVSADGTQCVATCPSDLKLTSVSQNNGEYFKCTACQDYYIPAVSEGEQSFCLACPQGKIPDITTKQCLSNLTDCQAYVSVDKQSCLASCNNTNKEYYETTTEGAKLYKLCKVCDKYYTPGSENTPSTCTVACADGAITDIDKMQCYAAKKECKTTISSDGTECIASCNSDLKETSVLQNLGYSQCTACQNYYIPAVSGGAESQCLAECPDGSFPDIVVKQCLSSLTDCQTYVSADSLSCIASCDNANKEYPETTAGATGGSYKLCKQCDKYYTSSSTNTLSTCTETCPEGTIQDEVNKLCLSALIECKAYVSSDSKKCISACDPAKKEQPIAQVGYKKCVVCTDYYTANEDITKSTCSKSCDSTKTLAIIPTRKCVAKSDSCVDGLLLSSDKTSCDKQCNYPDIKKDTACVTESTCTGEGVIIDETKDTITCASTSGSYSCAFKSSDEKRCVNTCVSIKEAEPANGTTKCQACVSPNKFYLIVDGSSKTGGCKASVSLNEQKALLDQQLSSAPKSLKEVELIKSSISDLIETLMSTITASSDNSKAVKSIEDYEISLLKQLQTGDTFTSMKNTPQSVGNSAGVKTVFQAAKQGKKFKKSLNIKDLISDSPPDLTEDNTDDSIGFQGIVYLIIKKNPGCNSVNCQDYPAIQVQGVASLSRLRLLPADQTFSADFSITQASQKYVCVTYDLSTNQVLSNTPATVSSDGTTATCALSSAGWTSLYLDTTCVYLDPSKCSLGSDDGLSAGGIVGIVIGSIAFASIVGVGCFFLYKHLLKKKQSSVKYKVPIQTENV